MKKPLTILTALAFPLALLSGAQAQAATEKPNILLIMSDDVGLTNVSAYGEGLVGYKLPDIERLD